MSKSFWARGHGKERKGREVKERTSAIRTVQVRRLPDALSVQQKVAFLHDISSIMNTSRPQLVLDCSSLREGDTAALYLMLHCLEEAMKRNGDVKLAALPAPAAVLLVSTGVAQLFETFDTTEAAVASFHHLRVNPEAPPAEGPPQTPGKAA